MRNFTAAIAAVHGIGCTVLPNEESHASVASAYANTRWDTRQRDASGAAVITSVAPITLAEAEAAFAAYLPPAPDKSLDEQLAEIRADIELLKRRP